jgi:L-asparaginase II
MSITPYVPIFEITRGRIVESVHFGALAVVDATGKRIASCGDPALVTYLRSSAKPFQVMPFVESGGPDAYRLSPKEISLMCASHQGTDEHVQTVRSIQEKTGVAEDQLMCGTHPVGDPATQKAMQSRGESPTPNRHNCSGKHTGMLAYTHFKKMPLSPDGGAPAYIDPSHPVQVEILQTFAAMCGMEPGQVELGIDGCSAPNFAVPLERAAYAFARLCDPAGLSPARAAACRTITSAMTTHPFMVGGPSSFDTALMEQGAGRFVCKGGAEGYQILGLMPGAIGSDSPGIGIAIKISDGDSCGRPQPDHKPSIYIRPAVVLEILRQLGVLSASEMQSLASFGPDFTIYNWRKLKVGAGTPCFDLKME